METLRRGPAGNPEQNRGHDNRPNRCFR